ncbi:hypothetical protein ACFOG5_12440 [Pedobacter fastidiosus]|uniref:Rod shape-determining protein MreD n=1 Tax=Pedobacter fastidiosus TaxID=2765361 RepID=A0ABR7KM43_9SPHI|nr:hypothetical protein [Pedobacter fastidiosus]MBC6109150.1 hypothetical protein [Pedobacter fastidiosus]
MKYLKIISIISFLLINGLGPHGIPNFAGILLCLYQFFIDIIDSFTGGYEISWLLGFVGISVTASISIVCFAKKYNDRYQLAIALVILLANEVFLSNILNYQKLKPYFLFPLLVFLISSTALIIKGFKAKIQITQTDI